MERIRIDCLREEGKGKGKPYSRKWKEREIERNLQMQGDA